MGQRRLQPSACRRHLLAHPTCCTGSGCADALSLGASVQVHAAGWTSAEPAGDTDRLALLRRCGGWLDRRSADRVDTLIDPIRPQPTRESGRKRQENSDFVGVRDHLQTSDTGGRDETDPVDRPLSRALLPPALPVWEPPWASVSRRESGR